MISNPKNGWCEFNLGDFHGIPSYITNVPFDLLAAFRNYLYVGEGICWFDEEGTEFTLVFTPYSLFIIEEKEKPILHDFSEMDIKQLAKEAITDIESDIDTWSGFKASCDDAESISINKELITDLIDLIKRKI